MSQRRTLLTVQGVGQFPADMLRYDEAWPLRTEDAQKIERAGILRGSRQVTLLSVRNAPTTERWESFGWRVVSWENVI